MMLETAPQIALASRSSHSIHFNTTSTRRGPNLAISTLDCGGAQGAGAADAEKGVHVPAGIPVRCSGRHSTLGLARSSMSIREVFSERM
jgi:hypothetical protein